MSYTPEEEAMIRREVGYLVTRLVEAIPATQDDEVIAEVVHRAGWLAKLGIEPDSLRVKLAVEALLTELRWAGK